MQNEIKQYIKSQSTLAECITSEMLDMYINDNDMESFSMQLRKYLPNYVDCYLIAMLVHSFIIATNRNGITSESVTKHSLNIYDAILALFPNNKNIATYCQDLFIKYYDDCKSYKC